MPKLFSNIPVAEIKRITFVKETFVKLLKMLKLFYNIPIADELRITAS